MKKSPQILISEIEYIEETIAAKELEVSLLRSKLTKLQIELAETTFKSFNKSK
ncbi:hypothetical protein P4571_07945 [Niallia alba]|uniref:hypothetical protein n=1 Tax=Niallia alba TaxID=2729105 RepID=UPI002E22E773|nr:hypothetical protein [Niallia alba]